MSLDLLALPLLARALVLGAFGGVGLALTVAYVRRGPAILPVYAALLAALALLVARGPAVPYAWRFAAVLAGFLAASAALYAAVGVLAERERARLRGEGRLPAVPPRVGLTARAWGHAWRVGILAGAGAVASAGVAFVAS